MAVFRVERNGDFTTMSNHHLKNRDLSLKAKGLLSLMLSLPDNWDYTVRGLVKISKDGENCIRATIKELERAGYIQRERARDSSGRFSSTEYVIREKPIVEKSVVESPGVDNPVVEKPAQLSTKEINTDKSSTDLSITHSFLQPMTGERRNDVDDERDRIKKQVEYDCLVERYNRQKLDELVEIMLEVALNKSNTIRIGRDQELPREYVQERFSKINALHIERVMDGIEDNTVPVKSTKAYLTAVLFNSLSTLDHFYSIQAKTEYSTPIYAQQSHQRYQRDYDYEPGESL